MSSPGFVNDFVTFYDNALARGDKRVEDWLLVKTPLAITVIFVMYLAVVLTGPSIMKGRNPINLKLVLIPYNFALVILSVYMFHEFLVTSYKSNYSYRCQPVDYSDNPLAMRMANVCWWFFFSKVIELLDTVFFIMRKKFDQVSFFYWDVEFFCPYMDVFLLRIVCIWTAHAEIFVVEAIPNKTQFMAFVLHTGYNIVIDCDFPKGFNIAVFLYSITLIILFGNFYYRAYLLKQREKAKRQ
ncbi:hypothetical protein KUTeg_015964 [Tegillarca granosa]|uniref:Elongation of very long chain fatty acids protein n=1 Tax=Tegillarca granosa TaxID=220873 RepID=A0ABQ9EJG2_TEGGR|nr:hypothetical protein KUTeg_015964 [Tegillarca granosa]